MNYRGFSLSGGRRTHTACRAATPPAEDGEVAVRGGALRILVKPVVHGRITRRDGLMRKVEVVTTRLLNAERSRRTRRALLDVGRALFAYVGYARTTTGELVQRTGVTRGALYYHFEDKTALFEAVFEEVYQESFQAMRTCMETAEGDPWERFLASLRVLTEQLGRLGVQRIVSDGPAVLGPFRVRQGTLGTQFLHTVFGQLVAEGEMKPLPLDPLCRLVWAACFEAALHSAQTETSVEGRQDMIVTLLGLIDGLRRTQEAGGKQD